MRKKYSNTQEDYYYYEVDPEDPDALDFMREYLITYLAVTQRTLFLRKLMERSYRANVESFKYLARKSGD